MSNYIWGLFSIQSQLTTSSVAAMGHRGTDIWQLIWNADWVVKGVLLILLIFSVVSWGIIAAKAKALWTARKENERFNQLFWHSGSLSHAASQTRALSQSPLATLFRLGHAELSKVMQIGGSGNLPPGIMQNLRRSLSRGQSAETTRLAKAVTFLATCANTSPFVGLFGTVWGIMVSFRNIGGTGQANLATVAPGIAEALVATATGLFAAIPAVVFYNHFSRRLQVMDSEMEAFTQDFLNLVERDLMRRAGPAVEAVRPVDTIT